MSTVLVVGGTGPTGPQVVAGLLERGHAVTVLHTGLHEVDLGPDVEHIHADPHFAEPLEAALAERTFDQVLGMYGRLAVVAEAVRDRTEAFLGISAIFYRGWVDDVLHDEVSGAAVRATASYHDHLVPTTEDEPFGAAPGDRFSQKAIAAERKVLQLDADGVWRGNMLRFPRIYGPRQPAPTEWSVIRRLLDGRRRVLVPDAGLLLESRAFADNAAQFVLAVVDSRVRGEVFNVSDREVLSLRQWIFAIADSMGREVELVSVPLEAAALTFAYSKGPFTMGHRVLSIDKARRLLGVDGLRPAADAIRDTVAWYLDPAHQPGALANDAFDYLAEDRLIAQLESSQRGLAGPTVEFRYRHAYRHPQAETEPGD